MGALSTVIKSTLPNYLSSLPVPDTFGGWFKLSIKDWLTLIPPTFAVAGIGYVTYKAIHPSIRRRCSSGRLSNNEIRKGEAKAEDMAEIERAADGIHAAPNSLTGDNLGPIAMVKKK